MFLSHLTLSLAVKRRKNRQFGGCKCPECDQTFINQTRLERHLAVHQIFGSFLCPLCGKTFKYEYNLFYHWRKTCRDLQDMIPVDDRQVSNFYPVYYSFRKWMLIT